MYLSCTIRSTENFYLEKMCFLFLKRQIRTVDTLCCFEILDGVLKSEFRKSAFFVFIQAPGTAVRDWECSNYFFFWTSTKEKAFRVKQFPKLYNLYSFTPHEAKIYVSRGMCLPSSSFVERLFSKVIFVGQRKIPKVQKKGQRFSCA